MLAPFAYSISRLPSNATNLATSYGINGDVRYSCFPRFKLTTRFKIKTRNLKGFSPQSNEKKKKKKTVCDESFTTLEAFGNSIFDLRDSREQQPPIFFLFFFKRKEKKTRHNIRRDEEKVGGDEARRSISSLPKVMDLLGWMSSCQPAPTDVQQLIVAIR